MKLPNSLKKVKRIIAAIIILILVGSIEIISNFNAITEKKDILDISGNIRVVEESGKEFYKITYEADKSFYVKQIKLVGDFDSNTTYTVKTNEINSFGKEEEKSYYDVVNGLFSEFYTDLNSKITSIEIKLEKKYGEELVSVFLSNRFEVNKYRILFWLVTLCLFYILIFESGFLKKPEWYFAVYALSFGILTIIFAQPVRNSWDEQIHFKNAYKIASGKSVEWSEAAYIASAAERINCNTKAEYAQLRQYMDEKGEEYALSEIKETSGISYSSLAYIPMALFLKVGMFFNMPFSTLFAFGKLGNLLSYVFVMFWAIRLCKQKKLFLVFVAMMPTVLFQGASYTYDGIVFSFLTLGCVLWANEAFRADKEYNVKHLIGAAFFFVVGSFSKAVYIPIVLLMLLLPMIKFKSKKHIVMYGVAVFIVFSLMMMTFVLPTLSNTVSGNISYGGDPRGGDTGSVRQIISMVKHPWGTIKLMIENIFTFDNFRNLGSAASDNKHFINLLFLNFATLGILADKWSMVAMLMLVLLVFYQDENETAYKKYPAWYRGILILICLGIIGLIWLAMYLSFTPVGSEEIAGVQARYYLPLVYFVSLICMNKKIVVKARYEVMVKMTFAIAVLLEGMAVYTIFLENRLL